MVDTLDRRPAPIADQAEDETAEARPRRLVTELAHHHGLGCSRAGNLAIVRAPYQSVLRHLSDRHPGGLLEACRLRQACGSSCSTAFVLLRPASRSRSLLGIPLGLLIGRFRVLEAAIGIYVTAGYAMPLVALVPLLVLWFGLGFAVKVVIISLISVFPICINTWLGVDRGAEGLDRGRQILRGARPCHSAPHYPAGDAALYHGRDSALGRARRGRHGGGRVLHLDLRARRNHS